MKNNLRSAFNTRQYMVSEDFELFYYSDTHFHEVPRHSHNYYEFYFFLEGDVQIEIDGRNYPLAPGDTIILPPGKKHRPLVPDSDIPYRRFVLWISTAYCNQLLSESPDYIYLIQKAAVGNQYITHFPAARFYTLQTLAMQLLEEIHSDRYGRNVSITLILNSLILMLNRFAYEQDHPVDAEKGDDLLRGLLAYIEEHISDDLSLDTLSSHFYVSKFYMAHYFKDTMGISLHRYILKKRLAACHEAISAGDPAARTCLNYGFKDYSSFYRAFRKEYDISPRDLC